MDLVEVFLLDFRVRKISHSNANDHSTVSREFMKNVCSTLTHWEKKNLCMANIVCDCSFIQLPMRGSVHLLHGYFQANLTLFHTLNALGYKCHTSRNVPWHLISDAATAVPFHNVQIRLYHDMNSTFFFVSITLLPFRKKSNVACI